MLEIPVNSLENPIKLDPIVYPYQLVPIVDGYIPFLMEKFPVKSPSLRPPHPPSLSAPRVARRPAARGAARGRHSRRPHLDVWINRIIGISWELMGVLSWILTYVNHQTWWKKMWFRQDLGWFYAWYPFFFSVIWWWSSSFGHPPFIFNSPKMYGLFSPTSPVEIQYREGMIQFIGANLTASVAMDYFRNP
jgi:hypothetical protein